MRRLALLFFLFPAFLQAKEPFRFPEGKHGTGELKYVDGIPVLTVSGTPAEMGEAVGVLGVKPVKDLEGLFKNFLKQTSLEIAWPVIVKACTAMYAKLPEDYRRELDAMAKSSGIDRDVIVVANTFLDLAKLGGCSTIITVPERSATGKLLLGRNLDVPPVDPLHEFSLVIVYHSKGKRPFVSVGFPGTLCGASLMNADGLCLAINEITKSGDDSPRFDPEGMPMIGCYRKIIEECGDVEAAVGLCKKLKFTTWESLTLADTKTGAIAEVTPRRVAVRKSEGGLCFCTNHFCCEGLATNDDCWRLKKLEKSRDKKEWSVADMMQHLDAVNQRGCTMQTMVFEPESRTIHLAFGKPPTSSLKATKVDFTPFLKPVKP